MRCTTLLTRMVKGYITLGVGPEKENNEYTGYICYSALNDIHSENFSNQIIQFLFIIICNIIINTIRKYLLIATMSLITNAIAIDNILLLLFHYYFRVVKSRSEDKTLHGRRRRKCQLKFAKSVFRGLLKDGRGRQDQLPEVMRYQSWHGQR